MSSNADNKYKSFNLAIPILRISLQILGSTLALAVIILTFLVWRMSDGPISLTFLRPHLEQLLNVESSPTQITFENFHASWPSWAPYVVFTAHNLSANTIGGEISALTQVLSAQLSVPDLLRGKFTFKKVDITGLNLQVVRSSPKSDTEINTVLLFNDYVKSPLTHLSQTIFENIQTSIPEFGLPRIEELSVSNTHLEIFNSANLPIWKIASKEWYLTQSNQGIVISIASFLTIGSEELNVDLEASYSQDNRIWATKFFVSDFRPGQFDLIEKNLVDLNATLSGNFATSFETISDIQKIGFELFCPEGLASFTEKSMFSGDYQIKNMRMAGHITTQNPSVFLESIEGIFNDSEISGSASLTNLNSTPHVNAAFDARKIPIDQLPTIWPQKLAKSARTWVLENISGGTLENITAYVDFPVNDLGRDNLKRNQIFGKFRVKNTDVEYINGLPPAENLFADGWFDGVDLHIDIEKGKILNHGIDGTTLEFRDVYTGKEIGLLNLRSSGPLSDLAILPGFSTNLISLFESKENQRIGGKGTANLHIHFPLISGLAVQDLVFAGELAFQQLSLQRNEYLLGQSPLNIADGTGSVFFKDHRLTGHAKAIVNQIPVEIEWGTTPNNEQSDLMGNAVIRTTLTESSAGPLKNFFLFSHGKAGVEITVKAFKDGHQTALVSIDASDLTVSFPSINFEKKTGEPVEIVSHLILDEWKLASPIKLHMSGKDLKGIATIELNAANHIGKISLQNVSYRKEKITADILFNHNNLFEIDLRTRSLALGSLKSRNKIQNLQLEKARLSVDKLMAGERTTFFDTDIQYNAVTKDRIDISLNSTDLTLSQSLIDLLDDMQMATNLTDDRALYISAKVENLYSSKGDVLRKVKGEISIQGKELVRTRIEGYFNEQEKIRIEITGSDRGLKIIIASENAGEFLQLLGVTSNLVGGKLYLEARYENDSDKNILDGQCVIENFHVTDTPIIAQLLSMSLPTNVFELLAGKGVPFARLNAPFRYQNSSLELLKARATGVSLGITVNGKIDLKSDVADIRGTIIPAYLLNNLVGTVPVIGDILTGPEKEGIFAANYSAKGPTNDLEIFVNPLTVLAPGILRDLFNIFSPENTQPAE